MEKDYNTKRVSRIRKRLQIGSFVGIWTTGAVIALGGLTYPVINTPSQPPVLERYEEIEKKLKTPLDDLTSGNLELSTKLYEIESISNFAETREDYESERQRNKRIGFYTFGVGVMVSFLSLIPAFLLGRKRARTNREYTTREREAHGD